MINIKYMLSMLDLTSDLRKNLEMIPAKGGRLNEDQADELRDLCNDKLDVCGYDEQYKLNVNGSQLAILVDKLYIGNNLKLDSVS